MKKFVYIALLIALGMMCSCSHKVYVPVEVVKEKVKVEKDSVRDSIYLRDSIVVTQKGDTVFTTKWKTKYLERVKYIYQLDSIRDSIPVPYPVEVKVEVEKPLSVWQKGLMGIGGVALVGLLVVLGIRLKRLT